MRRNPVIFLCINKLEKIFLSGIKKQKRQILAISDWTRRQKCVREIVYISLCNKKQLSSAKVLLSDIAEITTSDEATKERLKQLGIFFQKTGKREILSNLYVIEQINRAFPQLLLIPIGAEATVVEWVAKTEKKKRLREFMKTLLVCLISFFGTGFTIMAFHNDIGIDKTFEQIVGLVMGESKSGLLVLQIAYSIGLGSGIILFFNHVGKHKLTRDPTPIEVSMRNYEDDVNNTLCEDAQRRNQMKEAE